MIINHIMQVKDFKAISGKTLYDENIEYGIGDILQCNNKKWKVINVSKIHQGSWGTTKI